MRKAWTEAEIATLRRMIADGASGAELAVALNRPRGAISGCMKRLGLKIAPEAADRAYREALKTRRKGVRPLGIRPTKRTLKKRSKAMKAVVASWPEERRKKLIENLNRGVKSEEHRRKLSQSKLPDLHPVVLEDYLHLTRKKGFRKIEALRMLAGRQSQLTGDTEERWEFDARAGSRSLLERLQCLHHKETA